MRLASLALLTLALLAATPLHAACPPKGHDRNALTALAGAEWKVDDAGKRQSLALALVDCLASPGRTHGSVTTKTACACAAALRMTTAHVKIVRRYHR